MLDLVAFWLGASIGSFINVLIVRLPAERSLWSPPSHCPRCKKPIRFYDNVPLFAWLWLRGRCRDCRGRISWRYPAVELLCGLLAEGLWRRYPGAPAWAMGAGLAACVLVAVALIDWDTFLIPDELSLGLLGAGWLAAPINPLLAGGGAWYAATLAAVRGAAIGLALCWATAVIGERLFKKEAMGGGDIKLLAAIGAWSGGSGAFWCLMVASLLGSLYGGTLILSRRLRRSDPIPFGPFLSAAAILNFFWLPPLGFPFYLGL